jgi:hypothetical protein
MDHFINANNIAFVQLKYMYAKKIYEIDSRNGFVNGIQHQFYPLLFVLLYLKKNTIYWESFLGASAGRDSTFLRSTESEMDYHLNNGAFAYYPKLLAHLNRQHLVLFLFYVGPINYKIIIF